MANYSAKDMKIEFDATVGGALQDVTAVVMGFNGIEIEAILQEMTALGKSFAEWLYTGIQKAGSVVMDVLYDDTASTGSNAVFNKPGEQRTLKVTWGGTKTTSVETLIQKVARVPKANNMTMMNVTLQPTGTITEA